MTIPERILKLADFDEETNGKLLVKAADNAGLDYFTSSTQWTQFGSKQEIHEHGYYSGARYERDRLLPLIKSLAEIIEKQSEALDWYALNWGCNDEKMRLKGYSMGQKVLDETEARLKELGCGE